MVIEGDVLAIEVPVSFVEASLGAEVDVPVLDGAVRMRIPAGTQCEVGSTGGPPSASTLMLAAKTA